MAEKKDFYDILQVSRNATEKEIKKAYRGLAKQYHPDANPDDPQAEAKFKVLTEAYEILSDPQKRQIYDTYGVEGLKARGFEYDFGGFGAFEDIFEAFFGGDIFGRPRAARTMYRGADLALTLDIDFHESAFGAKKDLEVEKMKVCEVCDGSGARPGTAPVSCKQCGGAGQIRSSQSTIFGSFITARECPICRGTGEVIETPCEKCGGDGRYAEKKKIAIDVPAGIDDGTTLKLTGQGHAGPKGARPGDLYVTLNVNPHEIFRRVGDDVVVDIGLSLTQAALGAEIMVPALDGEHKLKIEAGTQPGEVLTLKNKGIPHLHGYGRGDQLVRLNVVTPKRLTPRQKEILREFAAISGEDIEEREEGFIKRISHRKRG